MALRLIICVISCGNLRHFMRQFVSNHRSFCRILQDETPQTILRLNINTIATPN